MTLLELVILIIVGLVGATALVWLVIRVVERARSGVWREHPEEMSDRIAVGRNPGSAAVFARPGDIDGAAR